MIWMLSVNLHWRHEVFRFDTSHLDPTAVLVAWVVRGRELFQSLYCAFSNAFSRDFARSFLGTYSMWSHVHFRQIMANPRLRKLSCTTRLQLQEKTPKKWRMEQPWASMRQDEPLLSKQFLLIQWCGDSLEGRVAKLVPHGSGYRKVADWVGWNHDFGIGDGWNGDGWIWMNNDEEGKHWSNSWKSKDFASSEASIHICFAGRLHHWTEGFSTFTSNRCYCGIQSDSKVDFSTSQFVIFRLLHVGEFPETNEASRSWRRNWGIDSIRCNALVVYPPGN